MKYWEESQEKAKKVLLPIAKQYNQMRIELLFGIASDISKDKIFPLKETLPSYFQNSLIYSYFKLNY